MVQHDMRVVLGGYWGDRCRAGGREKDAGTIVAQGTPGSPATRSNAILSPTVRAIG